MGKFQELTTKALPVPKTMWSIPVRFTAPVSEKENILTDVRNVVSKYGPVDNLEFNIVEVSGEWQGVKHVPHTKPTKTGYSQEQFAELSRATEMGPVILYLHGGAYIAGSPDTHRELTLRLAEGCGGRVFSLKYRLSPQA